MAMDRGLTPPACRKCFPRPPGSGEHLLDRLGGLVGDADGPADVRLVLFEWVDAQGEADGRQEVADRHRPLLDRGAVGAALADGLAALDAAAGEHRGPGVGEMVAAV